MSEDDELRQQFREQQAWHLGIEDPERDRPENHKEEANLSASDG